MRHSSVLRMIDANANRALEGIRVCEDILRFYVESSRPVARTRALRHAIARAVTLLPINRVALVRARNSRRDVGRRARASAVSSLEQLLLINFQRVKESLRTLEECTRLLAPHATASFQQLRFRTYGVERQALLSVAALRHR